MPTFEVVTTEVLVTTVHVSADTEEEAVENLGKGVIIRQLITDPELQEVNELKE